MNLFSQLFGKKASKDGKASWHSVIIDFDYGKKDLLPLFALENQLETAIQQANVGEFDGNEIAVDGSTGTLFMYGPDGDKLFAAVRPVLEASEFMGAANVRIRYGYADRNAREISLKITKKG
jgi:hypothetical protein